MPYLSLIFIMYVVLYEAGMCAQSINFLYFNSKH